MHWFVLACLLLPQEPPPIKLDPSSIPPNLFEKKPRETATRMDRVKRWRINLPYDDEKEFVKKLAALQVVVGARMKEGQFYIFSDLSKSPATYQVMTIEEFQKFAHELQRLWLVSHSEPTTKNFQTGAGLAEQPTTVFLFLPQDLELAIVNFEAKLMRMTEEQIRKKKIVTSFEITRTAQGWDIEAIKSQLDPNLRYP